MAKADAVQVSDSWPPAYKIKKHRLARSVKLRASATHGLVITTPYRFNLRQLPSILEEHRDWIIKQLQRLPLAKLDTLPDNIIFSACSEEWRVEYQLCDTKIELIERPQKELVLVGNIQDKVRCRHLLTKWVKQKAKTYLTEHLEKVSQRTLLPFEKTTVRSQTTLWGSCTSAKAISLNYKLIFLPPELTTHVMIHELCHTKHLNHSERFWRLVESFDENWRANRRALRKADAYIPDWIA